MHSSRIPEENEEKNLSIGGGAILLPDTYSDLMIIMGRNQQTTAHGSRRGIHGHFQMLNVHIRIDGVLLGAGEQAVLLRAPMPVPHVIDWLNRLGGLFYASSPDVLSFVARL